MPGPASERQRRQRIRRGVGRDGPDRERRADVRSGVDDETPVGRPHRIHRVLVDQRRRGPPVQWHAEQTRNAAWTAADVIDSPSGAHAGAPCNSSDSLTTRTFVPSACMTYSIVRPSCRTENAMRRPSDAIAGPPKIRAPGSAPELLAASPSAIFQMLSPAPFSDTYRR